MACGGRLAIAREEGRRRQRCPRCGWTFYDNPVPAVLALVERRGHVLMARRGGPPHRGTWDLPGGFVEGGEDPRRALAREVREELGARVQRARLMAFLADDTYGRGGFPILGIVYRATLAGRLRAASDVAELAWFPRARLPLRRIGFPGLRRALRRLQSGRPLDTRGRGA
jgi:ADP-ribose pyrophosphatase YjhB (NUDIX family)